MFNCLILDLNREQNQSLSKYFIKEFVSDLIVTVQKQIKEMRSAKVVMRRARGGYGLESGSLDSELICFCSLCLLDKYEVPEQ